MVDFGSDQGRSDVETAGADTLHREFQQSENAGLSRKMPVVDGHLALIQGIFSPLSSAHPDGLVTGQNINDAVT